jgi:uncharacterized protein (DUF1697 family)
LSKYVAFLRAINVGGHTVRMDHLRRLFEAMAFSNVETFIASGNVIFDSPSRSARALERKIEDALEEALGFKVATFVRTVTDLGEVARHSPFQDADADGNTVYIAFLADAPGDDARRRLLSFTSAVDQFHANGRQVYWLCRKPMSESDFSGALLEKTLGMQATLRNSTTVRKIASKYSG